MRNDVAALAVLAALGLATSAPINAQQPAPTSPAFEVTSVKRNVSGELNGGARFLPGGLFTVTNMPARALLGLAFRTTPPLLSVQIVGTPDWAGTDRYDMTAKMSSAALQGGTPTSDQTQGAVRSLLEDRFKLQAHFEKRELPIYALVVLPSGRLGPQLRPSVGNCAARRALSDAAGPNQQPVQPCGLQGGPGHFLGIDMAIGTMMSTLTGSTGRYVEDRTKLTGRYDVILDWAADSTADTGKRPSIFTALQEQLGLKLESTTSTVDVLVIDHVERPTED